MKLDDALTGVTHLRFDTAPIIYFIEATPHYDALVTATFQRIADGSLIGITSVITLTEVLIQPIMQGNIPLQQAYRDILLHSQNFQMLPVDKVIAEKTADLRVRYNLRIPDALQIAIALQAGCEAFLTNDVSLRRVGELRILLLDNLEL
jgi:predicted nucleic acid-binding protein